MGEEVRIAGWLFNRRSKGKIHFLQFRDGSGRVQAIMGKADVSEELFERCAHLPYESSVIVTGTVSADERAPSGVELKASDLDVLQEPTSEYPISKTSDIGPDFLLRHRHLWLRQSKQHAILRVRDAVITAVRNFFGERDFVCVDAPIFTPNACEGTTNLFEVEYFDEKAYLTQSGQLYMEAAAMAFGKAYCFGPTFRAEKSKTRRHLTEFWMVEPEVAFVDSSDNMRLQEEFISYIVERSLDRCGEELKVLERDTSTLELVKTPFPRISYSEAVEELNRGGSDMVWGQDL
ncbi:MAG: asparagine--tRNA ligase, partial [Planctomycetes bacterium]|nr:asparagine--tRNA ligase [Planctomycetota bacterium]